MSTHRAVAARLPSQFTQRPLTQVPVAVATPTTGDSRFEGTQQTERREALINFVRCGNEVSPQDQSLLIARLKARLANANAGLTAEREFQEVTIPVYAHVINKGEGVENGDVPVEQVQAQVDHFNETFKGTGFKFELASLDRTTNQDWYSLSSDESFTQLHSQLHKGGIDGLNLYINRPGDGVEGGSGLLGIAQFPWEAQADPGQDGVLVSNVSLPGGDAVNYNEGDTATHEVGHWLGLWHTFQGGCGGPGDEISDTPSQGQPTFGAPEHSDTCPLPGEDPIHNYMDYGDDRILTEFTPEQTKRMQEHWRIFRSEGGGAVASGAQEPKAPLKDGQKVSSTITIDKDVPFESLKLDFTVADDNPDDPELSDEDPRKGWSHNSIEDLVVKLKAPSGKEVTLFDHPTGMELLGLGIDIASLFPGEPTKGDWTLSVEDTNTNGAEGQLYNWGLVFGAPKS